MSIWLLNSHFQCLHRNIAHLAIFLLILQQHLADLGFNILNTWKNTLRHGSRYLVFDKRHFDFVMIYWASRITRTVHNTMQQFAICIMYKVKMCISESCKVCLHLKFVKFFECHLSFFLKTFRNREKSNYFWNKSFFGPCYFRMLKTSSSCQFFAFFWLKHSSQFFIVFLSLCLCLSISFCALI